uniref:Zinc finger CCCH-type containing 18 n=1 Tax=Latimeria chalumnae TaxID=7897 RepID=H3AHF0_LATCH
GAPVVDEILPPLPVEPPTESAWERGLRHAKEVLKKATIRKEQEPDFEEKRFTVTIGEEEREFDKENDYYREWNYRITREVRDPVLDPYADPYYDYEMERYWRGGQYENFRVQYTETEPYHYRENKLKRHLNTVHPNFVDKPLSFWKEKEANVKRMRLDTPSNLVADLSHQKKKVVPPKITSFDHYSLRGRQAKKKKKSRNRPGGPEMTSPQISLPFSFRVPAEQPKKETTNPQVKRADEWKDPWRRSKSPKKKLGLSGSPSRGRRRRRTSASASSASNSSRSSSRSSSYTGSGSSRSRSRSSSYSSYTSHSSRHTSFSGSRSRSRSFSTSPSPSPTPSPQRAAAKPKGDPVVTSGKGEKSVKKPTTPPPPGQSAKSAKPGPEGAKPVEVREGRRKERQTRTPPRRRTVSGSVSGSASSYSGSSSRSRSLSVSSVSSVSSASSSSSSIRSADSEDMYADLASPVSSASSHSPTPAQPKKEKGINSSKDTQVEERKRKREREDKVQKIIKEITQLKCPQLRPNRPPEREMYPTPYQCGFWLKKKVAFSMYNTQSEKGSRKRYEPSDKERQSSPPAKRAAVSPDRGKGRERKPALRPPSPKLDRQRGQNQRQSPAQAERKRPQSPQSKGSSKVTSVPGKVTDTAPPAASTKSSKSSTLSRREELLKQLKAVEDAIARKRAKIPGKV